MRALLNILTEENVEDPEILRVAPVIPPVVVMGPPASIPTCFVAVTLAAQFV
jgi:hypothetical protein